MKILQEKNNDKPKYTFSLIWLESFNTDRWNFELGNNNGWGNQEIQNYTENNVEIDNGLLKIFAKKEGDLYSSARITTKNKGDWKYGKFEILAKLPKGNGTFPAIWLYPIDLVYGG